MYDIKRAFSPYAIIAAVSLAIAAFTYEPSRAQVGTAAGAVLGAAVAAAFVSHPAIAVVGGLAGSVAGYRFAKEETSPVVPK
jgi:hypothetical protein